MPQQRPSPEHLLKRVQDEERDSQRGKLKIYLGAAPGVGKTYTMLQDAMAKRAQGLDVVVGIVESHGRKEIISLLKDLEILPRQTVDYHGKELLEFDLDGALRRNAGLILIDEMAHTNVPGLRHAKRWQDIKEILDRGIDVYTTLNVQHVDSLNDVVSQIIHTRIQETVPDFMLEWADTIELVDLPPEDLLKRLEEGKVYFSDTIELATNHFFRKGNLIALRELALRVTAERVGAQVLLYRQGLGIKHIWPTREKFLVCVGGKPQSAKIIRTTRRLAASAQSEWIAVHVDVTKLPVSEKNRNIAIQNLRLAEQLGAETRILIGNDIVSELLNFARERNVTTIVVWKKPRSRWKDFLFPSLANELVRNSQEIDVYILTGELEDFKPVKTTEVKGDFSWKGYFSAAGIVLLTTAINFLLNPYMPTSNLIMIYFLGITIVALLGKVGPSIMASFLSVIFYHYFFSADKQSYLTLGVMLIATLVVSNLIILTRRQTEASRYVESHTAALHNLSRQLASTRGVDKLLAIVTSYLAEEFQSEVMALLPQNGNLEVRAKYGNQTALSEKEKGVAQWVFDLGQTAGLGTDTLPFSDAVYVPLLASQGTMGVLCIRPLMPEHLFTPEQMHLLEACANQIALTLEVDRFQETLKKSELQTETDRARNALLQAVSHDVRTPLVAAMGAASTLIEMGTELQKNQIKNLGNTIYSELENLSRLINNLLQMTYLEAEQVRLQKEFQSLSQLIDLVIKNSSSKLGKRIVDIKIAKDFPKIPFDHILMQEVLLNLIDNAVKFTPEDSSIEIATQIAGDRAIIHIGDHGPGIMKDEVSKLFEKFYRGRKLTTERGIGLGLAICRSIVKAHGGEIWAENRKEGGALFTFTLPL